MLDSLVRLTKYLANQYATYRDYVIVRIIRGGLSLGVLGVCFWLIGKQIVDGYNTVAMARVRFTFTQIAISWGCTMAGIVLGAWEWILLVKALGGDLDLKLGGYIHLTSNLAKYVPGFIWAYAGRTYLAVRNSVPSNIAVLSVVCELLIVYLTGVVLLVLCLPYSGIISLLGTVRLLLQLLAVLLAVVIVWFTPVVIKGIIKKLASLALVDLRMVNVNRRRFSFVILAVLFTWLLVGFGFSRLVATTSLSWQGVLRSIIALIAALLIGQIAFFVPLGVGVREAVLVVLLGSDSPAVVVVVVAIVFRLESLVAEALGALTVLVWRQTRRFSTNNP